MTTNISFLDLFFHLHHQSTPTANMRTYEFITFWLSHLQDEVIWDMRNLLCGITHVHLSMCEHMCFPFQKVCSCWKLITPKACWCLESSHPRGKTDSGGANCNIPAGLSGYVNHRLDISGRGCACQKVCYI